MSTTLFKPSNNGTRTPNASIVMGGGVKSKGLLDLI